MYDEKGEIIPNKIFFWIYLENYKRKSAIIEINLNQKRFNRI